LDKISKGKTWRERFPRPLQVEGELWLKTRVPHRRQPCLGARRSKPEQTVHGFDCYGRYLENAPDMEPTADPGMTAETRLLVEETKLGCMMGLLLCFDREQRAGVCAGRDFRD
jgi:hypothetical protein